MKKKKKKSHETPLIFVFFLQPSFLPRSVSTFIYHHPLPVINTQTETLETLRNQTPMLCS